MLESVGQDERLGYDDLAGRTESVLLLSARWSGWVELPVDASSGGREAFGGALVKP